MRYLDVDLEIGPGTGRSYPLVVRSAAGDTRVTMQFPYTELALKDTLKDLRIALLQSSQPHRSLTDEEQAVQQFGQQLFEALFAGGAGNLYYASRTKAMQEDLLGVRLRLHIQAPDLAALPWEYLYDPGQDEFLCLSHSTSVVRYPELAEPLQPLQVTPPLRILGMIASPSDQDRLDVKREKARMEEALKTLNASGQIELTWLAGQTWEDLQEAMWHGPWHIFHFIGHGGYDKRADEGVIAFCDEEGQAHLLGARELARLLTAHRPLRLVVLNACDGAKGGSSDRFSSTAATLAKRGIPAVLAMQEEITDKAAIQLTRTFYRALANGQPVDAALDDARTAMSVALRHSLEWGTPVLYLRAPDSTLFTLSGTPTPPPAKAESSVSDARAAQPEVSTQPPAAPAMQEKKPEQVQPTPDPQLAPASLEPAIPTSSPIQTPAALPTPAKAELAKVEPPAWAAQPEAPAQRPAAPTKVPALPATKKQWREEIKKYHATGRFAEAFAALEQALALNPKDSAAQRALDDLAQSLPVGTPLLTLTDHTGAVETVAWSPDGRRLASAGTKSAVSLWDGATGQLLATLTDHEEWVSAVAWSPDGRHLASAGYEIVRLWDSENGQTLTTLKGHKSFVYAVAWSPDGQRLASAGDDKTVRTWDAASGQCLFVCGKRLFARTSHTQPVRAVAWSPDGKRLASASQDKTVRTWDAASGEPLATLKGFSSAVAWSPDNLRLASADYQTVLLWDAERGQSLATLKGHFDWVRAVAWSPDGKRLASASDDKTVRLWDSASGQALATLSGHTEDVYAVAWSPDGRRLASASDDQTVRLWWVGEG